MRRSFGKWITIGTLILGVALAVRYGFLLDERECDRTCSFNHDAADFRIFRNASCMCIDERGIYNPYDERGGDGASCP